MSERYYLNPVWPDHRKKEEMKKIEMSYFGYPDDQLDDDIEKFFMDRDYELLGRGYNFLTNRRDMTFKLKEGSDSEMKKKRTTKKRLSMVARGSGVGRRRGRVRADGRGGRGSCGGVRKYDGRGPRRVR